MYIGGCQNYGPLLGPLNTRCRIILRTQTGTMILATTHMHHGSKEAEQGQGLCRGWCVVRACWEYGDRSSGSPL